MHHESIPKLIAQGRFLVFADLTPEDRINELRLRLVDLNDKAQRIFKAADASGRELTEIEAEKIRQIHSDFEVTEAEIARREAIEAQVARLRQVPPPTADLQLPCSGPGLQSGGPSTPVALFRNLVTGQTVNGYRGTSPMSPQAAGTPLGECLRAILLNDFSGLPNDIRNSLTVGSDSGGGYLVAPAMSQRVIDLARANSVVMKAGATTVPMGGAELHIARLTGDPTVAWRGESGATAASVPTFGKYVLHPKTCAAIVPVSMELLEDAPNAGNVIENALMSALGVEVDRVILEGAGAEDEPLGAVNTSGVNSQTSVGTPTTYGQITTAITSILAANFTGEVADLAWIMNPTIGGTYDGLKTGISSDNTPLEPTPWVRQLRRLYTTNLAAAGSPQAYNMVVGDFRECLVGMRTSGVVIDVLDSGSVTDTDSVAWNANSQFLRFVRARIRVDSVLMRPSWFSVLSGVTA